MTHDQSETCGFLATVTHLLAEKFSRLRLKSCTRRDVDEGKRKVILIFSIT